MKDWHFIVILAMILFGGIWVGYHSNEPFDSDIRDQQVEKAELASNFVRYDNNSEIENIQKRLQLTGSPDAIGYIMLLNEAGQPILYEGVKGKVTSSGKRLTPPDRVVRRGFHIAVRKGPSDDGTWGDTIDYIYYWNTEGAYRQWSGKYLYSDQPFRLGVEPLVITHDKEQQVPQVPQKRQGKK